MAGFNPSEYPIPTTVRMIDSLIFDLDGTLWDTADACALAWNNALRELPTPFRPITRSDIAGIMGLTHEECFSKIFPMHTHSQRMAIAKICDEYELRTIEHWPSLLYEGVADGIRILSRKKTLYIVSNCQAPYLSLFLRKFDQENYFTDSESHGNSSRSKSENIYSIVKRHSLRHPVYVGDTAKDQIAAQFTGIAYWHMSHGFGTPIRNCPQFSHFAELVQYVEKNH